MTELTPMTVKALKEVSAIDRNGKINRFRLFSSDERRVILRSLPNEAAGLIDELEMINFETGKGWPNG